MPLEQSHPPLFCSHHLSCHRSRAVDILVVACTTTIRLTLVVQPIYQQPLSTVRYQPCCQWYCPLLQVWCSPMNNARLGHWVMCVLDKLSISLGRGYDLGQSKNGGSPYSNLDLLGFIWYIVTWMLPLISNDTLIFAQIIKHICWA